MWAAHLRWRVLTFDFIKFVWFSEENSGFLRNILWTIKGNEFLVFALMDTSRCYCHIWWNGNYLTEICSALTGVTSANWMRRRLECRSINVVEDTIIVVAAVAVVAVVTTAEEVDAVDITASTTTTTVASSNGMVDSSNVKGDSNSSVEITTVVDSEEIEETVEAVETIERAAKMASLEVDTIPDETGLVICYLNSSKSVNSVTSFVEIKLKTTKESWMSKSLKWPIWFYSSSNNSNSSRSRSNKKTECRGV